MIGISRLVKIIKKLKFIRNISDSDKLKFNLVKNKKNQQIVKNVNVDRKLS